MKSAALQQAIYDRLTGFPAVNDAVVGIYTTTPQAAESEDADAFPYITIDFANTAPFDTKTDDGANTLVDVHIWSRSRSSLTWRAISDGIYSALQKHELAVTGADLIECRFDASVEFDDPDGVTSHHVSTFRVTYFDA